MTLQKQLEYVYPEVLVDTQWVEDHLNDPKVRIAEVDYDRKANYELGHIPGSVLFDWKKDINEPLSRNILTRQAFEELLQREGVNNDTILILYGDFNNWFAAFAFWVFKYYGYKDVRLINGGRKKWLIEDRLTTTEILQFPKGNFIAEAETDDNIRAFLRYVRGTLENKPGGRTIELVDVRSPKEFTGEILAPPEYPTEQAQRGGHIPGAKNIPWSQAVNDYDGTFKSADELRKIYESKGITSDKEVIAYCRIGERSSHTWFVLKYLLGYPNVKNYDGSWTEWGNMIDNPIEKNSDG
ncbi:MAG: sulfurtransferase [Candidatus Nitrosopolaris sp.]|jgi:thiosulfate/3-mercaptopyruvate sulfurtransferase